MLLICFTHFLILLSQIFVGMVTGAAKGQATDCVLLLPLLRRFQRGRLHPCWQPEAAYDTPWHGLRKGGKVEVWYSVTTCQATPSNFNMWMWQVSCVITDWWTSTQVGGLLEFGCSPHRLMFAKNIYTCLHTWLCCRYKKYSALRQNVIYLYFVTNWPVTQTLIWQVE